MIYAPPLKLLKEEEELLPEKKKRERERERRFKVYIPQVVFLASRRISFPLFILTSACVSALLQVTN